MILIDPRDGPDKTHRIRNEMVSNIIKLGVLTNLQTIPSGDFCFDGYGPHGAFTIGVERKTLSDMMNCIDDGRYNAQRAKMKTMYGQSFLIVEGVWTVHRDNGFLMVQATNDRGQAYWRYFNAPHKPVLYSKLHNFLISVGLSGVVTTLTRDLYHTCVSVVEMFHYFQKAWNQHTSLLTKQTLNLPSLSGKPSLCRRWAAELTDVGVKFSEEAERIFRNPQGRPSGLRLATGDEMDWLRIEGIGVKTAQKIIKEIGGRR